MIKDRREAMKLIALGGAFGAISLNAINLIASETGEAARNFTGGADGAESSEDATNSKSYYSDSKFYRVARACPSTAGARPNGSETCGGITKFRRA